MSGRPRPLRERFEEKYHVDAKTGCWVWHASTNGVGYGKMSDHGRHLALAHRISYEMHVGPIPEGKTLDHKCRNRACVNPCHLEPVTLGENVLRGVGFTAIHARKTMCKRGHPFDKMEPRDGKSPGRRCTVCRRMNTRRRMKDPTVRAHRNKLHREWYARKHSTT